MELRNYQREGYDAVSSAFRAGHKRVLLQAPTGSGKTVVAAAMIQAAADRNKRCWFLGHTREIVKQTSATLEKMDVDHGVLMRGEREDPFARTMVCSKDTLHARAFRRKVIDKPVADLIIMDECHRSVTASWTGILDHNPDAFVVGLTATPARPSGGYGLGDVYSTIVPGGTYEQLIADGHLVDTRIWSAHTQKELGLDRCKKSAHDFNQQAATKLLNKRKLVGDIIDHWREHARGVPTICFAQSIDHSQHICEMFNAADIPAAHIDGDTDPEERDYVEKQLRFGFIQVLCNCMVLTEGWDCPPVACCILAAATKSLVKYRQMAGRIQRPHDGKPHALILDHAGNALVHGFPDDDIEWPLEKGSRVEKEQEKKDREPRTCRSCGALVRAAAVVCPECGHPIPKRVPKTLTVQEGELEELKRTHSPQQIREMKQKTWDKALYQVRALARQRDKQYSIGMCAHIYKEKWGVFPVGLERLPKGKDQWHDHTAESWLEHLNGHAV